LCTFASDAKSRAATSPVLKPQSVLSVNTSRDSGGIVSAQQTNIMRNSSSLTSASKVAVGWGTGGSTEARRFELAVTSIRPKRREHVAERDLKQPRRGLPRRAVRSPRRQRRRQRRLNGVFDVLQVLQPDPSHQRGDEPARLVAKEVFDQLASVTAHIVAPESSRISSTAPGICTAGHARTTSTAPASSFAEMIMNPPMTSFPSMNGPSARPELLIVSTRPPGQQLVAHVHDVVF
jgi:hypothetical protein